MKHHAALLSILAALALGACRTQQTSAPVGLEFAHPLRLANERSWRVVADGEFVGSVVLFCAADAPSDPTRHFYSVRNPLGQELGSIDGLGRAWRLAPHASEPQWVTTGTLLEGAAAILNAGPSTHLIEVSKRESQPFSAAR